VKQEVYRVARRCDLKVTLVANTWMRVPDDERISLNVVGAGADVVDALAAAWTARRIADGEAQRIPELPEKDARGLRMEMWW
jgi:hypothetical protein